MKNSTLTFSQFASVFPSITQEEKVFIIPQIVNNISDQVPFFTELYLSNHKIYFAGFAETHAVRKKRLLKKYPFPFNYLYYTGDFLLTRVSPKLSYTKGMYRKLSKGKGHVLSKTEILGKLYYCGFELVEEKNYNYKWYFLVCKKPHYTPISYTPKTGLLISLPRLGKNGKKIKVYKFRTMHPYAEFIQEYVHQKNELKEGGKFKNDFRINTIGRFMRKYWIDELPMLWNILKGDLKLVGVRPLSEHYFNLYDTELQQLRSKTKPGLLPPFYADFPNTLEEIQTSERIYLEAYLQSPLKTDIQYFFKIISNILFKGKRSA